jgi:hypothetical protein
MDRGSGLNPMYLNTFEGPYHVKLGWPCYVKFMVIRSYAYLKLKIPRPTGVITMVAKTQRVLDCEQNSLELATTAVTMAELRELGLRVAAKSLSPTMPPISGVFKMDEVDKAVQINAGDPAKIVHFGASLYPK